MKTRKNKNNFRQTRSKRQRGGTPEQDSQLLDAIISGDLTGAQALLDAGANVNASASDGTPALMWATIRGSEEIVRMLLDRGANVNASFYGNTSLVWASNRGNEEIVRMLLDAGANVDDSMSDGKTALIWASNRGNEEIVRMLLDARANVNASASNGETALHWATIRGNEEIVRMLLDAGANVTAPMLARERINPEIIQIIETHIQRKKDLDNLEMVKSAVQQKRVQGITPAMKTVFSFGPGTGPTFDGLLAPKGGKRKTIKTRKSRSKRQRGGTPEQGSQLLAAIISGDLTGAQALLNAGANVNASDSHGNTALIWASMDGYEEIVRMLLKAGANVNASNSYGNTALPWASISGKKEIVRMLLKAGANVNASDSQGYTALMMARGMGKQAIVQMIETHIERKKDLNNLEMVKSAVQQKRAPGLSDAGKQFFSFGPGTGPTLDDFLLDRKGGKRKTRKTRKSRSKKQRGRKL
jgi:ankyrin repeat protein